MPLNNETMYECHTWTAYISALFIVVKTCEEPATLFGWAEVGGISAA